jgi:hypothetical protein
MSQLMAAFWEQFNKAPPKEQHCWIGKNEHSHLEVLKTGRGVRERQRAAVAASIEHSPVLQSTLQYNWI